MSVLAIDGTTYGVNLAASLDAASLGRRFIEQLLDLWGVEGDVPDTTTLLVSELVTNAVRATSRLVGPNWGRFIVLRARITESELRAEVLDHSPEKPALKLPDAGREGGNGLLLVNELADKWGCDPAPALHLAHPGKAVWFLLNLATPPHPRSALPERVPLNPDEVIPAPPAFAVRSTARAEGAAQEPDEQPSLPRRAKDGPGSQLTRRPRIPSRAPAPSASPANAVAVAKLQSGVRDLRIPVA